MLSTFRGALINNVQLQQIRFGHRVRGKAPIFCKTVKERLDELNAQDELYTRKINIGLPRYRKPEEVRKARTDYINKLKSDKNLEKLARSHKIDVNLEEVRKEWLDTLGPYHKRQIADHYGIFEHLYGEGYFIPQKDLEIFYDLKDDLVLPVRTGNVIKPSEALKEPSVSYDSDGNTLWTLTLTSLDGHLTENDKEYVHWLVANIPGDFVEKGDTVAEYLQPFPLKGTGYHRYVFVLYKQDGRVSYDLPKVTSPSLEERTFVTRDWYQQYQDVITPAGLAFFQSDWDCSVKDFFHNILNLKEPVYEYDFPAPYIRPQEWFPKRKPFDIYMDRYRDPKQINKEFLLRKLKNENPFKIPPPPLRFPNAHPLPHTMPSWLKEREKKNRLRWGRINEV